MNNWQLFTLLVVPIAFNGFALGIATNLLSSRISALETRVDHGFELLTGRLNDLTERLARVEERLGMK